MPVELDTRSYITEAEALALLRYVGETTADVVEIGTFFGGTAVNIARHLPIDPAIALWTIDIFSGYSRGVDPASIYKELAEFERAFVLVGNSNHIGRYWGRQIGVLFIDGGHDYDTVSNDFSEWSRWVVPDGIIAMHDAKAVGELMSLRQMKIGGDPGGVVTFANTVIAEGIWRVVEEVDSTLFFRRASK